MKRYKGILALKESAREKTKPWQPPHGSGSDLVGESVVAICWRAEKFIGLPKLGLIQRESKKLPSRMQANCSQWASNTEGVGAPVITRGVCSVHNKRAQQRVYQTGWGLKCHRVTTDSRHMAGAEARQLSSYC